MEHNNKKRKVDSDESEVHHPHKKRRIESDLSTNVVLPTEIMLEIFEKLSPSDFNACTEVCKYWYECSANNHQWTYFGEAQYELDLRKTERKFYESLLADIPHQVFAKKSVHETNYQKPFSVNWTGSACTRHFQHLTISTYYYYYSASHEREGYYCHVRKFPFWPEVQCQCHHRVFA